MTKLCELCGETPVSAMAAENGYDLCEECASVDFCSTDGCNNSSEAPHWRWEFGRCERCNKADSTAELFNELRAEADEFAEYARAAGWEVETSSSELSNSFYLSLSRDEIDLKIRVSDHPLPPTYERLNGSADFDVGPYGGGGNFADARKWLKLRYINTAT